MTFNFRNNESIDSYLAGFEGKNNVKLDNIRKDALRTRTETGNITYYHLCDYLGIEPEDQITYQEGKDALKVLQFLEEPIPNKYSQNKASKQPKWTHSDQIKFLNEAKHYKPTDFAEFSQDKIRIIEKYDMKAAQKLYNKEPEKIGAKFNQLFKQYNTKIYGAK